MCVGFAAWCASGIAGADPAPASPAPGEKRPHAVLPPCAEPDADGEFLSSTGCSGVFGVRGSAVNVTGVSAEKGSGLMVSAEGEEFVRRGIFSTHGLHRLAIGGGGAGFEGALVGGMTAGFRIPFGERQGPIFRAGVLGYLRGNDAFYSSLLELPTVEVGYQYLRGYTVIEIGGTTGAVLAGRQRTGDAEKRILGAGLEVGGYAAVHIPWLRLALKATRLPTNDDLSAPVRAIEGTLCALSSPFAICADARGTLTDAVTAPGGPVSEVRSVYGGLAFGFTRER
jgi:hypothetical protein